MKISKKIIKAFTLAEILMVFFIIGIIASIVIPNAKAKTNDMTNRYMTYAAFDAIKTAISEYKAKNSTDYSSDGNNKITNAISEYINGIKINSASNLYTFANGIIVRKVLNNNVIYVDIDGDSGRKKTTNNATDYTDDSLGDIVQFYVTPNGILLPYNNNAKNYLYAKFGYDNAGNYEWEVNNISYKDAMCQSGMLKNETTCSTYCGKAYCNCGVSGCADKGTNSINAACQTHECEVFLIKPRFIK